MVFGKIFGVIKPKLSLSRHALAAAENRSSSATAALKIIHAGGVVEHYYMATPAARIMDKYPSFILARPGVFRRPLESLVKRDEILVPGQKYFVVPKRTIKKLRRKIKKNSGCGIINSNNVSFVSQSSNDVSAESGSIVRGNLVKPKTKTNKAKNRRVRFFGIDTDKHDENSSNSYATSSECINVVAGGKDNINGMKSQSSTDGSKRAARHSVTWHPSLTMINETFGHDD